MNKDFFITVICPCYNSSPYLERLINSLINKKVKFSEIIFSDDGSTDDTVEQLEKKKKLFIEKKINFKLIKNQHKGPGYARNIAIKNSSNKWIAFIDSDDTWKINKIEIITKYIIKNPNINIFLHWEKFIRLNNDIIDLKHGINYNNKNLEIELFKANFLSTSAVVCKKDLIIKADFFDENLQNGQDYDLWLKMSPYMNLIIIKEFLGDYIEEKNSITLRPYYKRFYNEIIIAIRHRRKVNLLLFIKKIFQIILSRRWIT